VLAFLWMHIFEKRGLARREYRSLGQSIFPAASAVATVTLLVAGCASPGPPLPPSLKLARTVTDLRAERIGDQVVLHWTTPDLTTDGVDVPDPITAEICRDPAPAQPAGAQGTKSAPCTPVVHVVVHSGPSEAADLLSKALPAALDSGPERLLVYRVQLRNAAGRTAGASAAVYAVGGASVPPMQELRVKATKSGALLEWFPVAASVELNVKTEAIELDRAIVSPPPDTMVKSGSQSGPSPKSKTPANTVLGVAITSRGSDPGGTIDHTAQIGKTYGYSAQRVRTIELGGQTLTLRSQAAGPVKVVMIDTFPPDPPTGLVAIPGFLSAETRGPVAKPTIDLSWQPSAEDRIAGYNVYRSEGTDVPERLITATPIPTPSYRDLSVEPGHSYGYRVSTVDAVGNESGRSEGVTESAPRQ
jgi:hypothetical protein